MHLTLSVLFITSCNQEKLSTITNNSMNIKSLTSSPISSSKPKEEAIMSIAPKGPNNQKVVNINRLNSFEEIDFDYQPPETINNLNGTITVIYKNDYKIRFDKKNKKVKSKITNSVEEMNLILDKYKLKSYLDLVNSEDSEDKLDKLQIDFKNKYKKDIPNIMSIHYYQFPKNADIISICRELKKLPYVRSAYSSYEPKGTSYYSELGSTISGESRPNPPADSNISSTITNSNYYDKYWFYNNKIKKGWNYYTNFTGQAPNVAVIDTGFGPNDSEMNYFNAYSVKTVTTPEPNNYYSYTFEVKNGSSCLSNLCALDLADDAPSINTQSHGSIVASVLGATPNNNMAGAGSMPSSIITPIKIVNNPNVGEKGTSGSLAKAIDIAMQISSIKSINISMGFPQHHSIKINASCPDVINPEVPDINCNHLVDLPITVDTAINTMISYATGSYNKPVIITAGNSAVDPTEYKPTINSSPYSIPTTNAIVVGGSMPMEFAVNSDLTSIDEKSIAWKERTDNNVGSNYDRKNKSSNFVDMTASAKNIGAYVYYPKTGAYSYQFVNGTSVAAPLVAGTAAMMKTLNPTLTAKQIKDILIFSSNVYKFDYGYGGTSSAYIGKKLNDSIVNENSVAGIRNLNSYNALVIAKNITTYPYEALTRVHNIDDSVRSMNGTTNIGEPFWAYDSWYSWDNMGSDKIFGIYSITPGTYLNFAQYNQTGECTFGYQVYRYNTVDTVVMDRLGGVSQVAGIGLPNYCWTYNYNYYTSHPFY